MAQVKLALEGGRFVEVDVIAVHGDWAVHSGPTYVHGRGEPKPAWTITHAPSGMRASCWATVGISKRDAIMVACHLSRQSFPTTIDEAFGRAVYAEILKALKLSDPFALKESP
jgi:hypothetical protein